MNCIVCNHLDVENFRNIDGVEYFECSSCGSIFADPNFIYYTNKTDNTYSDNYWSVELAAAKERSFGSSLNRVAELFVLSREKINAFVDIGTGPGYLLDSITQLLPNSSSIFYGVEINPPPEMYRTKHRNYIHGGISSLSTNINAGTCIEVIEHMSPLELDSLISDLSKVSEQSALYFFSSAQPSFVKSVDPNYLDPRGRGHIVSYSLKGLSKIFSKHGFVVIPAPGRDWCFYVEKKSSPTQDSLEDLLNRLWTPNLENIFELRRNPLGEFFRAVGIESARCYLESESANGFRSWALDLQNSLKLT